MVRRHKACHRTGGTEHNQVSELDWRHTGSLLRVSCAGDETEHNKVPGPDWRHTGSLLPVACSRRELLPRPLKVASWPDFPAGDDDATRAALPASQTSIVPGAGLGR